ncbi:MAG TPA: NTP transferase domain-containing protein, partial [Acidimicrobiia bacterium]|nr:NTP transferase domain-containing protein [Acidimicrobiia bacterium]
MHPVAVLAGGLGTRLREVTGDDLPKVMMPVAGRPFIDHKLRELRDEGARDVLLLLGHGAARVRDHVGDGTSHGLRVEYEDDGDALLGTGGALLRALPRLGERFWVTYGDTLLQVDVARAEAAFDASDALGLMTVLHNRDRWQPSNVVARDGY